MKILAFTSTYNRTAMLRGCVQDFLNQSFLQEFPNDCVYSINIACDPGKLDNAFHLYSDLSQENLHICVTTNNLIHYNHLAAIKNVPDWDKYDVYVKIDDDDFYKKDYIMNIAKFFKANPDVHVTSTKIDWQLNGNSMFYNPDKYDNLGGNGSIDAHMPMTLAFNRAALELLLDLVPTHNNDDMLWRRTWEAAGLTHKGVDNSNEIVWHIHGKNTSTSGFLQK